MKDGPDKTLLALVDISRSIDGIRNTVAHRNWDEVEDDWMRLRAVERGIEIISEASRRLPDNFKAMYPDIPWRQIAGIGNILRHEYGRVDIAVIANIVDAHLQPLYEIAIVEIGEREENT